MAIGTQGENDLEVKVFKYDFEMYRFLDLYTGNWTPLKQIDVSWLLLERKENLGHGTIPVPSY